MHGLGTEEETEETQKTQKTQKIQIGETPPKMERGSETEEVQGPDAGKDGAVPVQSAGGAVAALRAAFPNTIPVLAGYLFLGITYGVLMSTAGFPFYYPILTALIIYTGSMEFLMVSILASSFHPVSAFATALMVGARHLFYGISMLPKYRNMGWKKFYLIYTTSDETFSINYSARIPENVDRSWFYFWVSFLDQMYWVAGSAAGGIFGGMIPFDTKGLDFVMTAMFVVILMQQWTKDRHHFSEILGLGGSALCLKIFGPDHFIIPSMVLIFAVLTLMRGGLEKASERTDAGRSVAQGSPSDRPKPDRSDARTEGTRRRTVQAGRPLRKRDVSAERGKEGM